MPTCNLCGKENLVFGKTKAGKPLLMELRPHLITCGKRPRPQKKVAKNGALEFSKETTVQEQAALARAIRERLIELGAEARG